MNERSSRSHSVFSLRVMGSNSLTGESCEGVLNLVDLAGSERLASSGAGDNKDRLKETININKSLSALSDVIGALGQGGQGNHVPYRNSYVKPPQAVMRSLRADTLLSLPLRQETHIPAADLALGPEQDAHGPQHFARGGPPRRVALLAPLCDQGQLDPDWNGQKAEHQVELSSILLSLFVPFPSCSFAFASLFFF